MMGGLYNLTTCLNLFHFFEFIFNPNLSLQSIKYIEYYYIILKTSIIIMKYYYYLKGSRDMADKHMNTYIQDLLKPKEMTKALGAIIGTFLYALGMNLFIIPIGVYSSGIMGICQLIRTFMVEFLHIQVANIDLAGIIYYIINIPLFFIIYRLMGRIFFIKTMVCIASMTFFLTIIPIPSQLIITDDIITSCLIGGIICGTGTGLTLMMGSSAGGMDIVGIYLIKKGRQNLSVGKINLLVNIFIYAICFFLFDISIVIYSIIVATLYSLSIDKIHSQNINVEVIIITKKDLSECKAEIMSTLGRGITQWESKGSYTLESSEILYIILSKYEINQLKRMILKCDPNAFIVVKEGVMVNGNYLKKL